jgi:hypothetical protein
MDAELFLNVLVTCIISKSISYLYLSNFSVSFLQAPYDLPFSHQCFEILDIK